jgi:peptidoglycan/LPS O-acetylase OafA/YrhL
MTRRLPFIDAVKGIACLVIVVHHLAVYGPMSEVIGAVYPQLIDTLVVYGRLAVQVFFVVAAILSLRNSRRTASQHPFILGRSFGNATSASSHLFCLPSHSQH